MTPTATVCLMAIFQLFPRTTINLLLQLSKLASDVSCVTIQHRCISSTDLAWMVQNNHLQKTCIYSFHGWIIFAVTSHIATTDIFDRHVLDIEAHIVPRKGFTQCFMVHFYRLHFSCYIDWSKGDHHARFKNTSLHTTHRDNKFNGFILLTTNFVDILERQTQGFVSWASWWQDAIQSFKQGGSTGIAILTGDFPSLEPWHLKQEMLSRNWHKCYCVGVVANFLNVGADFLNNFLVSLLAIGWLSGIHFVNSNN
ncbi:hypothetical protein FD754_014519 [Muntiacus muntjak]|uniref:Uncharacterized protein n=1 Tax=Muntiacus muntjak TaxID=9888 RepID=A0A5N3VKF8_MUNMU|nr:hypothetical protein FD754_014519 [Muntiacus muntjak]